jgi:hypothetical protein
MASSRRSYDTDSITLRTVFAKNPGNSNIPALRVLTADGAGATYWAVPSTLGQNPSFNQIITSAGTYTSDLSYNTFRLTASDGIGMLNGPTGSNQTLVYARAFRQFDISGNNTINSAYGNLTRTTVTFAGENGVQLRGDPTTNTFFIGGSGRSNTFISTGIYGFSQVKVTPSVSSVTSSVQQLDGDYISANSPSTLLRFLGVNDIQLSTNITTNSVFFTISTFTSQGYLNISNAAYSAYPSTLSTVSSLYVPTTTFISSLAALSSSGVQWSSVQSSINALAISTGNEFYRLTGLINARATIIQLNATINQVNSNIVSSTKGVTSLPSFVSSLTTASGLTTVETVVDFAASGQMTYSSFSFNLSSFSNYITSTTSISIQESPSFIFSGISTQNANYDVQYKRQVSYIGLANNPGVSFAESYTSNLVPYSISEAQSNFFGTPLQMTLRAGNAQTYIQSNLVTYHTIPSAYFFSTPTASNWPGFKSSTMKQEYSANSLFLHIYNS